MTRHFSIRMIIGLITAVALAACSTGDRPRAGRASSDRAEQNIKQLEVMRRPTRGSLDSTRDELIAVGSSLNAEQIERLMAVALDTGQHEETRKAAIAVVLAAVEAKDFSPVQRLCDELRSQVLNEQLKMESRNESQRLLQDGVVVALTRNEALQDIARSDAGNRMLLEIATSRCLDGRLRTSLEEWLTAENPDQAVGSANALALITRRPTYGTANAPVIAALDESARAQLRTLVRESIAKGKLHLCAAGVLAHLGDESIVEPLLQYFAATNDPDARRTGGLIWQIEIQKTNAGLLAFLATPYAPQEVDFEGARSWALIRAVERKIPRDDIRAALYKHAESAKVETRRLQWTTQIPPRTVTGRFSLSTIKCEALRLGIFTKADWPDVGCIDAEF